MNENSNTIASVSREQASEQILALGGIIVGSATTNTAHSSGVSIKTAPLGQSGYVFHAFCADYNLPREFRDKVEERTFGSATEAAEWLDMCLTAYDKKIAEVIASL